MLIILLLLVSLTVPAYADYSVSVKEHCGIEHTLVQNKDGTYSIIDENSCQSTGSDWKDS